MWLVVRALCFLLLWVAGRAICGAGSGVPGQYWGYESCRDCEVGNFCPNADINSHACPAGHICPSARMTSPTACPAGTFCPTTRMTSATPCPAGSYCPARSISPLQCTAGRSCPTTSMTAVGPVCTAGNYCPAGSVTPLQCPAGSFCVAGASWPTQCPPGTFCPAGSTSPLPCTGGRFCPNSDMSSTTPCPAGSYCPERSISPLQCTAGRFCPTTSMAAAGPVCTAGNYCPAGSVTPLQCPAGSSCVAGASWPTQCPPGTFCPAGSTSPLPCTGGRFCPNSNMSSTISCTAGTYCPVGSVAPLPCPAGSFCPVNGAVTPAKCPAGNFCPAGATAAMPCPMGYYCPAETTTSSQYPCPAGYYCPVQGLTNGTAYPCPPGFFCPSSGLVNGKTFVCPAGSYCLGGSLAPTPCGLHEVSSTGAAACVACRFGTMTVVSGSTICLPCNNRTASATCSSAEITWMRSILIVHPHIGSWNVVRVRFTNTSASVNASCAPVFVHSGDAITCTLTLMAPQVVDDPIATVVSIEMPLSITPTPLNMSVTVMPVSPVLAAQLHAARRLAPLQNNQQLFITLPDAIPSNEAVMLSNPLVVQGPGHAVRAWVNNMPCSTTEFSDERTVVCHTPSVDGYALNATVELYGVFNLTGTLTDVVQRPIFTSSTVVLPAEPQQTVNVTVVGINLCVNGIARVNNTSLCDVPCAHVQCISNSSIQCMFWPLQSIRNAAAHPSNNQRLSCDVSASWRSSPITNIRCEACITIVGRPMLEQLSPRRVSGPGEQLLIAGSNFHGPVNVTVGGKPCHNISRLVGNADVVTCTAPDVPGFMPGYPRLPVFVSNVQGVPSTETRNVLYPAAFEVQWATPLHTLQTISGFPLVQPPTLHIFHRDAVSCSISIEPSSIQCPHTTRKVPTRMKAAFASPLVLESTGGVDAVNTTIPLDMLLIRGERGCMGALVVSCVDGAGKTATTSDGLPLSIIAWNITTGISSDTVMPITPLTLRAVAFNITTHPNSHQASDYRCMYTMLNAESRINEYYALEDVPPSIVLVSGSVDGVASNESSSVSQWYLSDVNVAGIDLHSTSHLHIECQSIWYDERVRMPVITYVSPIVTLSAEHTSYAALTFEAIHVNLTLQSSFEAAVIPEPACTHVIRSTSSRLLQLSSLHMQSRRRGPASWHITFTLQLEGPSDNQVYVEFQCALWTKPHIVSSSWVRFESISLHVMPLPPLPQQFLSSDAGDPVAVQPFLQVYVDTTSAYRLHHHVEVTCSLTTSTKGATVVPFGRLNIESYSTLTSNSDNTVLVPPFAIQAASLVWNVTLQLRCVRDASGDILPPFSLQLTAIQLRSSLCDTPMSKRISGEALPSFRVAVSLQSHYAGESSCHNASSAAAVRAVGVGSIACSITPVDVTGRGGNGTSNNTEDMLSSVFTQQATQLVDLSTMTAKFERFTVFAPPSFTYRFAVECTMGSTFIPPALLFTLHISGCLPGMERRDVFCVSCGTLEFSMGTGDDGVAMLVPRVETCTRCPPVGADCLNGLLLLKKAYYRPPERTQDPFGPTTALYPCYNGKACVVNSTTFTHSCAEGYTGPICSVCDVARGYARSGEECALCGNPAASITILISLVMLIFAYLLRTALRKERDNKTKAAITLKIAIGYMQAVGSLKSYAAGGTALYRQLMGWTDTFAASPLSVAALQCVWDASHIARYVLTVLLPIVACATVIACVVIISALKHVSITKRTAKCDVKDFIGEMRTWIHQKRYFSTFLFVLFLSYMAIMSASLDCYAPIEGVVYLRQDMRVECGSPPHVTAVVVAIATLLVVGVGFPALLYWVVGRSTPQQLADTTFFQQWGFLYDGYRSSASASISKYTPRHLMWWEAVVLCRKVGVVCIAVLVKNAYMQNGLAALWLGGALILHIRTQPYTDVVFNRLETMSLASSCCIAIISSMLLQDDVTDPEYLTLSPSQMSSSQWLVTVVMILLSMGTFVCFAALCLYYFLCQVREKLIKSPYMARFSDTIRNTCMGALVYNRPKASVTLRPSQCGMDVVPRQSVVVVAQPQRSSFAPLRWTAASRSSVASKIHHHHDSAADTSHGSLALPSRGFNAFTENPLLREPHKTTPKTAAKHPTAHTLPQAR